MNVNKIHFIGFVEETERKVIGLTDEIEYFLLPLLINFSILSLNIINAIKNNFSSYAFIIDNDNKNIIESISNIQFSEKIEQIAVSSVDQFNFFSSSILNYINNMKISDDDYLAFIPCDIDYLWKLEFDQVNVNNLYMINFIENKSKGFIIKVNYLKYLIEKNKIEHFKTLYSEVIKTSKYNFIQKIEYSFRINNLKDYLELHLRIFQSNEIYLLIKYLSYYLKNTGETFISKEAAVTNSYIGYNTIIKGKVEDSIIFNDVIILNESHIQNSIILPGNVLAKGVNIKNAIIGLNKNPLKDITIGPYTKIGYSLNSSLKNIVYEHELPDGYSLIGNNILLPGGINIGKNCVLRGQINILELKKMKNLIDGGTFEQNYNS
ncbi:MAG: hypothetical protein ACK4YF_05435 [Exilispira sp.]